MKKIKPKVILGIILVILMIAAVLPACATLKSAVDGEATSAGYEQGLTKNDSFSAAETTAAVAPEGEAMAQSGEVPAGNAEIYYAE